MTHKKDESNDGTIFKVNTDGTGFTTIYRFAAGTVISPGVYTNSTGSFPVRLILSGSTLYGITDSGGALGGWNSFFRQHQWHEPYEPPQFFASDIAVINKR